MASVGKDRLFGNGVGDILMDGEQTSGGLPEQCMLPSVPATWPGSFKKKIARRK